MASSVGRRVRLSVDVEPELRKRLKLAATERDMTLHDYVVTVLLRVLTEAEIERAEAEMRAWTRLSAEAFARDWNSEEDRAYDQLS